MIDTEVHTSAAKPPYEASWIDRLIGWIERLPGSSWLFYVLAALAMGLVLNALLWIDGGTPLGEIHPLGTAFGVLSIYWIGLYHHLTGVGARALGEFRPLLDIDQAQVERLRYELGTLPAWLGWVSVPLGLALAWSEISGDVDSYVELGARTPLPIIGDFIITAFLSATFLCVVLRSLRQLRTVSRLNADAANVNLLKLAPAHAFSALTARTSIGLIIILVVAFVLDPAGTGSAAIDVLTIGATSLLAVAVFALPIIGIRRHIEAEKQRRLDELGDLLEVASARLRRRIEADDYAAVAGISEAIEALIRQRQLTQRISAWPWNPGTIRGFGSALLLPIFIWLVTQLLERFLW